MVGAGKAGWRDGCGQHAQTGAGARRAALRRRDYARTVSSIYRDAALERRFQKVYVAEPSVEDTIAILRGLKERL